MTFGRGWAGKILPVAGFAVLLGGSTATAQPPASTKDAKPARDDSKQNVPLPTADGAELSGTYYRTNRGRDAPCVLMIHDRGKDSSKVEWDGLARALQGAGYAVLTFDLRGHGRSTTVTKDFWKPQYANLKSGFKGAGLSRLTAINAADYKPNYWPWLVQDVAAARRFLDVKNDVGELNAQSVIVIGAGEGASLGLLFVATEFVRYYRVGIIPLKSDGTLHNAGDDIAGAVWLSALSRPTQGGHYNLDSWVRNHTGIREKVPMGFIFGEKDAKAKADAEQWVKTLKTLPGGKDNPKVSKLIEIKGTELAGQNLLANQGFGVGTKIVEYCDELMRQRRAIPWAKVDSDSNTLQVVAVSPFGFRLP